MFPSNALEPIAVFVDPLELFVNAPAPNAELKEPVVLNKAEFVPTAVLQVAFELFKDQAPNAELLSPVLLVKLPFP